MSAPTEAAQSEPETDGSVDPRAVAGASGPSSADALSPAGAAQGDRRAKTIETTALNLFYGDFHAVEDVTMKIEPNKVTALIGSSGCGKTTFLRSLNRMHELTPGASVKGDIELDGEDIYGPGVDPVATLAIEDLIQDLKGKFTIAIVTHNMQQAARASDYTAFLYQGELVEFGETAKMFTTPEKKQTEDYIRGKFG